MLGEIKLGGQSFPLRKLGLMGRLDTGRKEEKTTDQVLGVLMADHRSTTPTVALTGREELSAGR